MILANQYLVVIDGHSHVVGKDRRCHTCDEGQCEAVSELARYLKASMNDTIKTHSISRVIIEK